MIIVPHSGEISWKNPPAITLFLILVNSFIFFTYQGNEDSIIQQSYDFYHDSGLAKIEQNSFLQYLKDTQQDELSKELEDLNQRSPDTKYFLTDAMYADEDFVFELTHDKIITPDTKIYSHWKKLRREFEEIQDQTATHKYGYKPAKGTLLTAFTYMFLHGSVMHLVGNMVFLWLVGCMIEIGCNRLAYTCLYILTGLASSLLFGVIYHKSNIPLVGASGAIAGLMGFYTIMYAKKKVGIFLSLGFYFTNTRVPAIALLPFWIGNEFYQLFFGGASNVAYVGHLGGLLSGALLGVVQTKFFGGVRKVETSKDKENALATLLEKGLQQFSDLDFQGARESFEKVLEKDKRNRKAMLHLFQIERHALSGGKVHIIADKLLQILCSTQNADDEILRIYQEYIEAAKKPELSPDTLSGVLKTLIKNAKLSLAAITLNAMLKTNPQLPQLPAHLLNLAKAYMNQKGGSGNARKCLLVLEKKFPESIEFKMGKELLGN